jgi:sec-independent protein translocase protein TatB
MSSIGLSEWVLLALIGLIVLGPERLPRIANQLGNWIGQARRMTRVMRRQLEEELNLEKANSIKPATSTPVSKTPQPVPPAGDPEPHIPANEEDDSYSPAHDAEGAGTGVGDDEGFEVDEPESAEEAPVPDDNVNGKKESNP